MDAGILPAESVNIPVVQTSGNPPQGLVKTLTIWYIKHNLWGYEKS